MKEEELIALIDDVLRDDDKNNDGYIDYAEFAKSLEQSVFLLLPVHDDSKESAERAEGERTWSQNGEAAPLFRRPSLFSFLQIIGQEYRSFTKLLTDDFSKLNQQ